MVAVLLLCLLALHGCAASRSSRASICRTNKDIKCVWLEDHFSSQHGFPLQGDVSEGSRPVVVYCYEGDFWSIPPNPLIRFWDQLRINIDTDYPDRLLITRGNDSTAAMASSRPCNVSLKFSPYDSACAAVKSTSVMRTSYGLRASYQLNLVYPVIFLLGAFLLFLSPKYSRNATSVYTAGVLIGVLGSVLVLLYIISRLIPGRNFVGLGILAGGTTLYGTLLYWSTELLAQYWKYVLVYVLVSGLISFAVLYIKGVSNPRTMDVLCWMLQLVGVGLLYLSTSSHMTSIFLVAILILFYVTPLESNPLLFPVYLLRDVLKCLCRVRKWVCPPKLPPWEYITPEEYEEQGRVETGKELKKLRESYLSGKLDTSHLSDPARFDRFARGEDHVTAEEQVSHDWDHNEDFIEEEDDDDEVDVSADSSTRRYSSNTSSSRFTHRHHKTGSFSSSSS